MIRGKYRTAATRLVAAFLPFARCGFIDPSDKQL